MVHTQQLHPHVYALPALLSASQIATILLPRTNRQLSFCGPGAGEEGHTIKPSCHYDRIQELEELLKKHKLEKSKNHKAPKKPSRLSAIAESLWPHVQDLMTLENPVAVDPMMKIYRLEGLTSTVSPHQDDDFAGPDGTIARWSLLVYLNDEFDGGETVFDRTIYAPNLRVGSALLFRHDVLHEGLPVLRGEKYVLKTDVFCR